MTSIYTFIVNYRGGTYISRINANSVSAATHLWASQLAQNSHVAYLDTAVFSKTFRDEIEEYPPTPIDDNPNVWCLTYFYGRNRMEVHIVKTDPETSAADLRPKRNMEPVAVFS